MKYWTSYHTFDHPWETVMKAAYRKYPNPVNTAVLGADVIERKVVNGVLYSHRIITSKWCFPSWTRPALGNSTVCYASEESEVDPAAKEMVIKTKNVSFCKYITVGETVKYVSDPQDPNKTHLEQEATIVIRGVPLINYMEDLLTSKIAQNANKGRQAMEWVIEKIQSEMKDLASTAAKSTDELLNQTRRQFDDITIKTIRSMDDLQNVAKKSFDEIQNMTVPPPPHSIPKL